MQLSRYKETLKNRGNPQQLQCKITQLMKSTEEWSSNSSALPLVINKAIGPRDSYLVIVLTHQILCMSSAEIQAQINCNRSLRRGHRLRSLATSLLVFSIVWIVLSAAAIAQVHFTLWEHFLSHGRCHSKFSCSLMLYRFFCHLQFEPFVQGWKGVLPTAQRLSTDFAWGVSSSAWFWARCCRNCASDQISETLEMARLRKAMLPLSGETETYTLREAAFMTQEKFCWTPSCPDLI